MVAALDDGRLLERYPVEADGAHPAILRRRNLTHEEREIKRGEIERRTARADQIKVLGSQVCYQQVMRDKFDFP